VVFYERLSTGLHFARATKSANTVIVMQGNAVNSIVVAAVVAAALHDQLCMCCHQARKC